jgi:hypothetical protein
MILLDDELYKETKSIVLGEHKKSELLNELSDWCMKTYSIRILNIQFSKLNEDENSSLYRLYIIVKDTEDFEKMYTAPFRLNEVYEKQITDEFRRLALKYQYTDPVNLQRFIVRFNDFSEESKTDANWQAVEEAKDSITSKYPMVWHIEAIFSSSVVFYYSDDEISRNEKAGISQKIVDDYYSILKKYDELNYFTPENLAIKFDSKENLDKNYQGSLFNYTQSV